MHARRNILSESLAHTQARFARALLDCDLPVPDELTPRAGSRARSGFDVYRNNIYAGLVQSVLAKFPVVQKLVGLDFAKAAARHFVECDPPSSPVLIWYGATFPDFLEVFEPALSVPYLADVARLEWAIAEAASAADALYAPADALTSLPDEDIGSARLALHPAVRVVCSEYPTFSIWAANSGDDAQGQCRASGSESALIVRPAYDVRVVPMEPGAAQFVRSLRRGATIDAATSEAFAAVADFDLTTALITLFSSGAIAGVAAKPRLENRHASNP